MISVFSPTVILLGSIVFLNLVPALYIWLWDVQEGLFISTTPTLYRAASTTYLASVVLFLVVFCVGRLLVFPGCHWFSARMNDAERLRARLAAGFPAIRRVHVWFAVAGAAAVWVYFVFGGYEKLTLFGSGLDAWDYRMIGYDDRSRILIAALEASRRVLLPYAALYLFVLATAGVRVSKSIIAFLLVSQLVGAVVTFDRAPILLFFVMFAYVKYCRGKGLFFLAKVAGGVIGAIMVVAGVVTFIQYNMTGFSVVDVLTAGGDFLLHRTITVPSTAAIELGFHLFPIGSEKLHLAYARLGALFTGRYVGSQEDASIYVTPVGAIADVWRNFGFGGIAATATFLAWYFRKLDAFVLRASPVVWIVGTFNILSLCFYFIFGLFFSQGVFFQMLILYLVLRSEPLYSASARRDPAGAVELRGPACEVHP